MATADEYAAWIVKNAAKKGSPEFDTVAKAYQLAKQEESQPVAPQSRPDPYGSYRATGEASRDLMAGAVRGAGSIGATLLAPKDAAENFIARTMGAPELQVPDRRKAMTAALGNMGADTDSNAFGVGKVGTEIAGTLGVGPGLANAAGQVLPKAIAALPWVQKFINAVGSSGMTTGGAAPLTTGAKVADMGARMAGGAVTGGASAGLVDPDSAGTGAAIGAGLPVVAGALNFGGSVVKKALGATTGAGDKAIQTAVDAGRAGGAAGEGFRANMRGQVPIEDVLNQAKSAVSQMGQQKQAAYRAGMANIKADKTVLDMTPISKAVDDGLEMTMFKGQVKNGKANEYLTAIKNEIDNWRSLDPAQYHTPEGLDALKQKIGAIVEAIPYEQKTALQAAGGVYNSIKGEITKQAPEYAKVMRGYSEASETIKEVERALVGGKQTSADTAMRKLQSLMRNNVNTSYGYRTALADQLESATGVDLFSPLAGQALNDWVPRGIQRAATGTGGAGLLMTGNPVAAAGLAAVASPRLIGEAAHAAGRLSGSKLAQMLKQGAYYSAPVAGSQLSSSPETIK